MSNVRSVIEIEVNDSAFKNFYDLFHQYSSEIDAQPETWRKLSEAMGETTSSLEGGALSGKDALALAAAQATVISEAIREAAASTEKLESGTKRSSSAMEKLKKGAEGVSGAVKSIVGGVLRFAEFAGLGGLLGGFGITGLSTAAFNRFRSAGQLGLTPGQLASFQVNAQPFLSTSSLEAAANAQIDISKAGQLGVLGIDFRKAQAMDTGDLAFLELRKARAAYIAAQKSGLPPLQSPVVSSYLALGGDLGELRFAAGQSDADLLATQRAYRRDQGVLGFDRNTALAWTNLKKNLDKAGLSIETSLIRGLAPLAPQLSELTKSVADLITGALGNKTLRHVIDDAAKGIEQLAKFLEGVNWDQVGADVGKFGEDVVAVVKFLGDKLGWLLPKTDKNGNVQWWNDPKYNPVSLGSKARDFLDLLSGNGGKAGYQLGSQIRGLFDGDSKGLADAWHFLTSPIAGPAAAAVLNVAQQKKVDPLLALAMGLNESGLNPRSVGDSGHSLGIFQLNDAGEGAGMSDADRFDAATNARVALGVLAQKLQLSSSAALNEFSRNIHRQYALMHREAPSHAQIEALAGSPGLYAAIAQRPQDPFKYARDVNALYKQLHDELPGASGGSHKSLERTIKKALQKRTQKPATVSISNSTAARVSISANAAAIG